MKDIDFDELDRAVNSLMKSVPENPAPKPDDQTRVVTLGSPAEAEAPSQPQPASPAETTAPQAAPALQNEGELSSVKEASQPAPEPVPEPEVEPETTATQPEPEATPAPSPAARRGRFMDVVRPSAARDAKQPLRASRHGRTLQPSAPSEAAPETDATPPELESSAQMPEPTMAANLEKNAQEDTANQSWQTEAMPEAENTAPEAETPDEPAPLNSPFLPGAKVEKRPLGRPAEAGPAVDLAAELANSAPEADAAPSTAEDSISPNKDAQLPEQPLPAELDNELLSIETSADTVPVEPAPQPDSPEAPEPAPAPAAESTPTPASAPAPAAAPTSAASTARAMAATSIPQQYKVQPSQEQEVATGAIYDTQPLAHPAKKKPGWLWVIAIIAIILAGAGSGALVYYLGLL